MSTGWVSSDDDDDFYSDPLIKESKLFPTSEIQTRKIEEELEVTKKYNLLLNASLLGDFHTLENLIQEGVSVDISGPQEWTALMKACSCGNYETTEFLLNHGADPNIKKEKFTPLMSCCIKTHIPEDVKLNCVRLLLQHNALVNAKDKYHITALMYASESKYRDIVQTLLSVPEINVNIQNREGQTALFYAVVNNDSKLVKKFIEAGCDINLKDRSGRTALDVALIKQFYDLAQIFGYVEENIAVEEKIKKNQILDILSDIPNSLGEGGFTSDVKPILNTFVKNLKKKISLPEFLNMTEKNLQFNNILFEQDRKKLLKYVIHQYHLTAWRKTSMPVIIYNNIELTDGIDIAFSTMKHLTIACASLRYLTTRVINRKEFKIENLSIENELVTKLIDSYYTAMNLKTALMKIITFNNEIKVCVSDDYIEPFKNGNKGKTIYTKGFWCMINLTLLAYVTYNCLI